ncbi:MAG: aconitate hydratase AcnA [Rhizobiales bacterium]|nr:aconitate hydratase AcnA [Hyphomicrobiales bacterium]
MKANSGPAPDLLERLPAHDELYVSLARCEQIGICATSALPLVLKILVECALRHAADPRKLDIAGLAAPKRRGLIEFRPARLLLQDFTGLPLMTDLASLRDAVAERGIDPARINPRIPVDFVVDHALIAVHGGRPDARALNERIEVERNAERFSFLKWCEQAFDHVRLLPPGSGIMHQLNLEYLASVVRLDSSAHGTLVIPDTLIGTDSHTPMVGGLGVLGWGVGGIEAQAAILGHGTILTAPRVVGLRLTGQLRPPATSTDAVLHVTELLRRHGVTGAFIEAFGEGLSGLPVETRATIANMAPEYGATSVLFPIDTVTLDYLRLTGRDEPLIRRVEAYAKAQGLWHGPDTGKIAYDDVVELNLDSVEPCMAGPKRPEQRVPLGRLPQSFTDAFGAPAVPSPGSKRPLVNGDVVLAAITSCTHTANPAAMLTAGLLARNAMARGLGVKPWVKTTFAPGSRVVAEYLAAADLQASLDALGFQIVGFGCTTCNGNSGPLLDALEDQVTANDLSVAAVLSGNRNFQGRIHPLVRAAYLASPALVVAYAIAGTIHSDLTREPLGVDRDGRGVMLADIWPSERDIAAAARSVSADQYAKVYHAGSLGHEHWSKIAGPRGDRYPWDRASTFLSPSRIDAKPLGDADSIQDSIQDMRLLAIFGDGVTTDHLSPNGEILPGSPAAKFLAERGVPHEAFGNYAARRGNFEIALRGMFANPHLENEMMPGRRGNLTVVMPDGQPASFFEAGMTYVSRSTPTVIVAGRSYGSGSSRDWAAKGVRYLGVRAVLAQSFESIYRANLVNVGVLPLLFPDGYDRKRLALNGHERIGLRGLRNGLRLGGSIAVDITRDDGETVTVDAALHVLTVREVDILRAGGMLPILLEELVEAAAPSE